MIVSGSRYNGQPVISVPVSVTQNAAAVFRSGPIPRSNFVYYKVREGDRFDIISNLLYGVPDYWWRIADANPEIFYPDQLLAGSIIRLPTV